MDAYMFKLLVRSVDDAPSQIPTLSKLILQLKFMIFDLFPPPHGPRGRGQKCAFARPIHVSNSHTKSGWISSDGLKGDSITDGRTVATTGSTDAF